MNALAGIKAALLSGALIVAGMGTMLCAQAADAPEALGWRTLHYVDVPLRLTVKTGEESILQFPWRVEPGVSSDMLGMLDRPRAIGDTFYFTPASPFEFQRFTFLSATTGAIILMDIQATDSALPVRVIVKDSRAAEAAALVRSESPPEPAATQRSADPRSDRYTVIELAQYAMQVVYAPEREIREMPGLTEVTVRDPVTVVDLVPGALVEAVQWKEWRTNDGRFLSALVVKNKGGSRVTLDPTLRRHSRYDIASTPYSSTLAPHGMPGDTTTLVIISSVSWNDAISLSRR